MDQVRYQYGFSLKRVGSAIHAHTSRSVNAGIYTANNSFDGDSSWPDVLRSKVGLCGIPWGTLDSNTPCQQSQLSLSLSLFLSHTAPGFIPFKTTSSILAWTLTVR